MATTKSIIPNLKNSAWKKWGLLIGIFLAVYLALWLMLSSDTPKVPQVAIDNTKSATTNVMTAGSQIDARERWIGTAGAQLAKQEKDISDLSANKTTMDDRLAKLETLAGKQNPLLQTTPVASTNTPVISGGTTGVGGLGVTNITGFPPGAPMTSLPVPASPTGAQSGAAPRGQPPLPNSFIQNEPEIAIGHVSLFKNDGVANTGQGNTQNINGVAVGTPALIGNTNNKRGVVKQASVSFLPVGFAKARLLGGMDAPTNGQAQNEPLPVIMEIIDDATLPNGFRAKVKKCMVIGAAWGDLSSERAYIRLETLSCIKNDGSTLEVKAKGSVYGEDGKLGVRGRLVSKQGQILANALLAGAIGGIGQGIQYRATTTSISPLAGAVTTTNPNQGFEAGFGGGVGRALDRLANYYITLAEKTFPVIEVDSSRLVDVAFTKGIELDTSLPDDEGNPSSRRVLGRLENGDE